MRLFAAVMVVGWIGNAAAQEPAPPYRDPYGSPPSAAAAVPAAAMPPASTAEMAMPPSDPTALRMSPQSSRSLIRQWRGARAMNGFANAIGLISAGLSVSSAIYVGAAHYPPSLTSSSSPRPSDPAQLLSYVSSSSSAFGFALAAGGLGLRHHILRKLDADPGRGLFVAGTVVGLVGVASIITSYIVGFANVGNPHDQSIAVLATSLGGSAITNVGTAIYAKDASQVQKAWKALTTF
jgi:hypothetical protein